MHSELLLRAYAHLAAGRPGDAAAIARVVIREIEPLDPAARLILSQAAHAGGDFSTALKEAGNAVALAPDDPQYRKHIIAELSHAAMHPRTSSRVAGGARQLLDRLQQTGLPEPSGTLSSARSVDLLLPMSAPAGAELNAIETARKLRSHVPCRIWSDMPPHPRLLELDPSIEVITAERIPDADAMAIMGLYMRPGAWLERLRPRRIILRYNVNNFVNLLAWLGATAKVPAERTDILFASAALRDAVGVNGSVVRSLTDTEAFIPRGPIQAVSKVGRLSRDAIDKHHPQDGRLYLSLLEAGLSLRIMGGTEAAPFLPTHDRLEVIPAYATTAPAFLQSIDLFLYRTGTFFESWGRVVIEAMASGLPVVCHRLGGYAEVIRHGENGLLFSHNYEAVEIIAEVRNDSSRLKRIGEAARQTAVALSSPARQDELIDYFVRP